MKKIFAVMLAVVLVLSVGVLFAAADDNTAEVYVTISDVEGKLALAAEKITVTDIDGDNALTINDALYAAHEQFYEGGAAAGYATGTTQYGLSLTKLWGTANGYSYGYMVNNVSAWSMTDPVKTDDYVAAYVFTDTKYFADKYSYFDKFTEDIEAGEVTLTLNKSDFDKDWNPITVPVEGAVITVDGAAVDAVTDAQGQATFTLSKNGRHVVSAAADGQVIVPPVYVANVTGGEDEATPDEAQPTEEVTEAPAEETTAEEVAPAATEAATDATAKAAATKDTATATTASTSTPKTGDGTHLYLWLLITALCLCGVVGTVTVYKKHYEK